MKFAEMRIRFERLPLKREINEAQFSQSKVHKSKKHVNPKVQIDKSPKAKQKDWMNEKRGKGHINRKRLRNHIEMAKQPSASYGWNPGSKLL